TCSYTLPSGQTCTDPSPVLRRYTSFTQASDENGLSRILVGFHFRKAVKAGIRHGTQIRALAVNGFLPPGPQTGRCPHPPPPETPPLANPTPERQTIPAVSARPESRAANSSGGNRLWQWEAMSERRDCMA